MMNHTVVLINPPLRLSDRYGEDMKKFGAVSEPLGIAYVAAYLESRHIRVRIMDAQAEDLCTADVVADIIRHKDTIIGISVLTPVFSSVKHLCAEIKKQHPDCRIVLGGPHCTALPERTLHEIPQADIVCVGEGEITMAEIIIQSDTKGMDEIKGICFRKKGETVRTVPRPYLKELDQIPPPARHLLPMGKYHLTASRVSGETYCPTIIVARGCPFTCTYCSRTFGRTFRSHSTDRILSEIRMLIDNYRVSQINIEADTLTVNKKFLADLCNALIDSGINRKIRWTCESRVDTVNEQMLRLMRKAGCWQISYGVETGNQRLLDMISKGVTLKQIEETFRLTRACGISIRGFFMLGLPTETREESLRTIAFAKKLDPLWAQFTITVPYPGTKMFEQVDQKGEIRTYDWSRYNTWSGWKGEKDIPFVPRGRTVEELYDLQKKALRDFYLRPKVAFRFLRTVRSFADMKKYMTGFLVLVKTRLKIRTSFQQKCPSEKCRKK